MLLPFAFHQCSHRRVCMCVRESVCVSYRIWVNTEQQTKRRAFSDLMKFIHLRSARINVTVAVTKRIHFDFRIHLIRLYQLLHRTHTTTYASRTVTFCLHVEWNGKRIDHFYICLFSFCRMVFRHTRTNIQGAEGVAEIARRSTFWVVFSLVSSPNSRHISQLIIISIASSARTSRSTSTPSLYDCAISI